MRSPRASAVVVALSTFVAVSVVAVVVSQLTPIDRAGALLPEGPITVTGVPLDDPQPESSTGTPTSGPSEDDAGSAPGSGSETDAEGATIVEPVPAATVDPEPSTPPAPVPSNPGNSGGAPGQTSAPGNSGSAPGQGKP